MEKIYSSNLRNQYPKIVVLISMFLFSGYTAWLGISTFHTYRSKFGPFLLVLAVICMVIVFLSLLGFREMYYYRYRFWKGRLIVISFINEKAVFPCDILYVAESDSFCSLILYSGERFVIPCTYEDYGEFRKEFQSFAFGLSGSRKTEKVAQSNLEVNSSRHIHDEEHL